MLFGLEPEQFDILGALAFLYIVAFAILSLKHTDMPLWSKVTLLLVGLGGLLVDVVIVYLSL